jgi:hypothetical protein
MAYYPIKCPYCLREHTNESVLWNLGRHQDAGYAAPTDTPKPAEDFGGSNTSDDWDFDDTPQQRANSNTPAGGANEPTEGYFTIPQLNGIFGEANVELKGKSVDAAAALTRVEEFPGDLCEYILITRADGSRWRMHDRYCNCDPNIRKQLHALSGAVPSYTALLMGSSNSGKTVYLTSLYRSLNKNFPLPPFAEDNAIATVRLQVSSKGDADTSIDTMSENLFYDGILPPTTISMTNEPLTLTVTVAFKRTGVQTQTLLYLRDLPGEALTNPDKSPDIDIQKIASQFPNFDGFLMVLDPLTFEESVFPTTSDAREQRRQNNRLNQVIADQVAPRMPRGVIDKPTAVLITKGDYFFHPNYSGELRAKGVAPQRHLLPRLDESFDKPYFDMLSTGARELLQILSADIYGMVEIYFPHAFFTLVSALNQNPISITTDEEGRRRVADINILKPWRVAEPALQLLIKLNVVPPFDRMELRGAPNERPEQTNARTARSLDALNKWGEQYCTAWKPYVR